MVTIATASSLAKIAKDPVNASKAYSDERSRKNKYSCGVSITVNRICT